MNIMEVFGLPYLNAWNFGGHVKGLRFLASKKFNFDKVDTNMWF